MKPGDRVEILKRLATKLVELNPHDFELTLETFGFPVGWWDWPGDDPYPYAVNKLKQGTDEQLFVLYEHLYGGEAIPRTAKPLLTEGRWESGQFRLFMTHISSARAFVTEVKLRLAGFSIDGFVAHEDIEPTKEWVTEIELALETCDALVAILTPDFHTSNWTDQELGYCIKRRVLILPVRMGLDPYGFIGRYQALPGGDPEDVARSIFDVLLKHDLTSLKMAEALVTRLENSHSFDNAKANMTLVERVLVWTPELLQKLEAAIDRNSQVADAWGVPQRIRSLVQTHRG